MTHNESPLFLRSLFDIPLRERKHARTRLELERALIAKLQVKSFNSITVKELAEEVSISEVTFFNYFPKKTDLIFYMLQMWVVQGYLFIEEDKCTTAWSKICRFFDYAEKCVNEEPRVTMEIMAFLATAFMEKDFADKMRAGENPHMFNELTEAEWVMGLDLSGEVPQKIREVSIYGLRVLLMPWIEQAIAKKELPENTPPLAVFFMLLAYFHGFSIMTAQMKAMTSLCPQMVENCCNLKDQLQILFEGIKQKYS